MNRMVVKFRCPECGGTQLEERATRASIGSTIKKIDPDIKGGLPIFLYGPTTVYGRNGDIYYRCPRCGYILQDEGDEVSSKEELFEWLEQREMLKPEKGEHR